MGGVGRAFTRYGELLFNHGLAQFMRTNSNTNSIIQNEITTGYLTVILTKTVN